VLRDPYRRAPSRSEEPADEPALFEEHCLVFVLVASGGLGLAVSCCAPAAHGPEIVIGALLVMLGLRTVRPRLARKANQTRRRR